MTDRGDQPRTLCVIPARGGSKGVPDKNIAPLLGRPLIHYAITAGLASETIDRLVVSSDSPEILAVAEKYPGVVSLSRGSGLSSDNSPSLPVVVDALRKIEEMDRQRYDRILLLQCVAPMVLPEDINGVLAVMDSDKTDSAVTLTGVGDLQPGKLKILKGDRVEPYLETETQWTRQLLPDVYIRNSSCYAASRETIDSGSLYGASTAGFVVPRERFVNIDEPVDLVITEAMMKWLAKRSTNPFIQDWVAG